MKLIESHMRFFIDQNVPDSVGRVLEKHSYEVLYLRKQIPTNSPDSLVAAVAQANDAILISFDPDFKGLASRSGAGQGRFRKLSIIRFEKCSESLPASRLEQALSLIEHEWSYSTGRTDRRIFIVITTQTIRTNR